MKTQKINNNFTTIVIELSETEVKCLINLFESFAQYTNQQADTLYMGMRGNIYAELKNLSL